MEAWTRAEPARAEAWFYLGGAYGARSQLRVLRHETLAAARDGKRIKDALERSLQLDPGLSDAYFGIGLYHYYADVAPAAAKVLRFLLLLPGGNRAQGMQEMLRARDRGQLLRSEADYQLHVIDIWYENQPEKAIELLSGLRARHPHNPHFPQSIAEIEDVYLHDSSASLRTWRALLAAAERGDVREAEMAEARARLGIALQLDRLFETDAAIDQLRTVIADRPASPFGVMARAHLQLAQALDRLGQRPDAVEDYRAAIAAAGPTDPLKIVAAARQGLRTTPDPAAARAYRLSLEGWRALERGALANASRLLMQSLAIRPDDPVTRYRHARLMIAQKNEVDGLVLLDALTAERDRMPGSIYAVICFDAARLNEQRGNRDRAIELYETVRTVFGADERLKAASQNALAQLNRQ
jgi:tetratricopeptide (TPR) repeat protein